MPVSGIVRDALVPADHCYRHMDRLLDRGFVRTLVWGAGAERGRPSIFFKLQLVRLFTGIRSERQVLRLAARLPPGCQAVPEAYSSVR